MYSIRIWLTPHSRIHPSSDEQNNPTRYVIFDSSQLTLNRTVQFPDLNIRVVGEASSQTIENKLFKGAVFVIQM